MSERLLYKLNSMMITLLFLIAIFVPFFISVLEKDKKVSVIEKRELSSLPKIGGTLKDIKKFPKLFDTYYSDHFGFRDLFAEYYKSMKLNLGDSPSNDVIIGKDGWLFLGSVKKGYTNYSDPIGDVRNVNLFSNSELKAFAAHMSSLKKWLKDKGVEYVFVIAPNKHTVYFDKLPDYITKVNEYSSTDQLVSYLRSHTDIVVVDLRKVLIEEKNRLQLYYKTDTHWNHNAANIAQYEIMLEIEKLFPKLIDPEVLKLNKGVRTGGDLGSFIGMNTFNEIDPQPVFKNSCIPAMYPKDAKGRETFSSFCEGQKLNTVIFRDSFFSALQPYFSRKFKRSTYVWGKLSYASLKKYIKSDNPDIVIEEWLERDLPLVPNAKSVNRLLKKKLFEYSSKSIFLNHFRQLKLNEYIERLDDVNKYMNMKSIGIDPIIYFPSVPLERGVKYIVHIEINSSIDSTLQLFYSDREVSGYPFLEKNSVKATVELGKNNIYILLDYKNLGKHLRLDPISGIGEIKIRTIEIREIYGY